MIWLVDDDDEGVDFFREGLQRNGYSGKTRFINSGIHLLELLEQCPREEIPSVIVLDLNMHTKSGFEVLREIKAHRTWKSIPVIILSGSADKSDEERCLTLGCNKYWIKPSSMLEYDPMARYLMSLF